MAEHYRKVHTKLWADAKFNTLGDDAKLVWFALLTAPSISSIPGVIVQSEAGMADLLGWSVEAYRKAFAEVLAKGFEVASEGRLVWVKNAMRYQAPESPNNAKYWRHGWSEIPECSLKHDIWKSIKSVCLKWWEDLAQGFPEPLAVGLPQALPKQSDSDSDSEKKKDVPAPPAVCLELADHLRSLVLEQQPGNRLGKQPWEPNRLKWAREFDQVIRLDDRTPEQIRSVLNWVYRGQTGDARFVVQAPKTLREKWDRIELRMAQPAAPRPTWQSRQEEIRDLPEL